MAAVAPRLTVAPRPLRHDPPTLPITDTWLEFNDEHVRVVDPKDVRGAQAYLLFYQAIN